MAGREVELASGCRELRTWSKTALVRLCLFIIGSPECANVAPHSHESDCARVKDASRKWIIFCKEDPRSSQWRRSRSPFDASISLTMPRRRTLIDFSSLPLLLKFLIVTTGLCACTPKPLNQPFVASFNVDGNDEIATSDITDQLATRDTPLFAGVARGLVYDYETYNPHVLSEDLLRIQRLYHSRGFHNVHVRAGRVVLEEDRVRVTVVVNEGPRTSVRAVQFSGLEGLTADVARTAKEAFESEISAQSAYEEEALQAANDALTRSLQDNGYAFAKSEFSVRVDIARELADVFTTVHTGPRVVLGNIEFRGFRDMPEDVIRGYVPLESGKVYDKRDFEAAELELMNLGVFTSITVQLSRKPPEKSTTASRNETELDNEKAEHGNDTTTVERDPSRSQPSPDTVEGVGVSTTTLDEPAESETRETKSAGDEGSKKVDVAQVAQPSTPDTQADQTVVSPVVVEARLSKLRALSLGGGLGADIIKSEVHLMASWRDQNMLGGLRDFLVSVTPGLAFYPTRVPDFAAPDHFLPQVRTQVQLSQPGIPEAKTKTV
jgi:hypothetical protein